MKSIQNIGLSDVQAVYGGPEGDLWELVMGEQIHIGGLVSSMDLAEKAGIEKGTIGIDLCCCNGAGMRFLVRFREVARMIGVDATRKVVERGRSRCMEQCLDGAIEFVLADACESELPSGSADFVWGEDAWCYVVDKARLISEAARLVRAGGTIAFTDWIWGPSEAGDAEAERLLTFMKFANIESLDGYRTLLEAGGCEVTVAENTGRFAPQVDLYITMLTTQLTYDALRIIGFDAELMQSLAGEMEFMQRMAHEGKIAQGLFVGRKTG